MLSDIGEPLFWMTKSEYLPVELATLFMIRFCQSQDNYFLSNLEVLGLSLLVARSPDSRLTGKP